MQLQRSFGLAGEDDLERRWHDFFRDPSKWWDNRRSKLSPRHSDLKHMVTKEPLWMDSPKNPSWVMEKLMSRQLATSTGHQCNGLGTVDALSPAVLWSCCKDKDLQRGTRIHNDIRRRGLVKKDYSDALVTLYAKCGQLQKAQAFLDMYNSSSSIPWNSLIAGYAREGKGQTAFHCFEKMQQEGLSPTAVTYTSILKACAVIGALDKGRKIHDEISRKGLLQHDLVLGNALVTMYVKCGDLGQAQRVLEKLPFRNVVTWSALIAGYAQNGQGQQALFCFEQMQRESISPNEVTYVSILQACAVIGSLDKGKKIHDEISRQMMPSTLL
ncbi:hypothetical protein L7F22_045876 [Adiantum nelumboides]|nr:hypothetical protein [Adiantum nelumboides]